MNLTTRCPSCGTAFRVQPAQLSARGGKVRCGKCTHVFDGVAALVAEAQQEPQAEAGPSPQLALFEGTRRKHPVGGTGEAANEDVPVAEFMEQAPRPVRRLAWASAALLAFTVLAAQAAHHFRTEIAVLFPESRTYLAAACAAIKCEVRMPRRPKLMAIESSDLQADGRRENLIVLNAVLRNQAQFAQEYPALELTLTDERDEAVARRVLLPADYLAGLTPDQIGRGAGAGAETALRVYFDTGGLRAIGYRMYLFFP
ncbi:MAG: DUF3426 domain-containing protein [Candidatus Parcubacteria bacterium]|nr:DUF3426 domain-containing protein [Burkholderiales bacterium]